MGQNWNVLHQIDVVGCFVYPNEKVHAGEQTFLKKEKKIREKGYKLIDLI